MIPREVIERLGVLQPLIEEVVFFSKAELCRSDAWDAVPVLPNNPWRKCHTKNYWVWYRREEEP